MSATLSDEPPFDDPKWMFEMNRYVRAIGRVTGSYEFNPNTSIRYRQFRPAVWLMLDQDIPITELYDRSLSQQTLYKLDEAGIKKESLFTTVSR